MKAKWRISWQDSGIEPNCPPDPSYPDGVDLEMATAGAPSCTVTLPYPSKRLGAYVVTCRTCGLKAMITTAGRPDDPRSARIACRRREH